YSPEEYLVPPSVDQQVQRTDCSQASQSPEIARDEARTYVEYDNNNNSSSNPDSAGASDNTSNTNAWDIGSPGGANASETGDSPGSWHVGTPGSASASEYDGSPGSLRVGSPDGPGDTGNHDQS
ncbi:hypothetical protein DFQ27_002829, partial [Actinomortierella ambigua]